MAVPGMPLPSVAKICAGFAPYLKRPAAKLRGFGSSALADTPSPWPLSPWHEAQLSLNDTRPFSRSSGVLVGGAAARACAHASSATTAAADREERRIGFPRCAGHYRDGGSEPFGGGPGAGRRSESSTVQFRAR